MIMPRPLSGCQIKAKIKDFLLRYRLFQYQHWFFPNLEVSRILEMTAAPCNGLMSQSSIPAPPNTSDRQSISTKYGPNLYFRALRKPEKMHFLLQMYLTHTFHVSRRKKSKIQSPQLSSTPHLSHISVQTFSTLKVRLESLSFPQAVK